MKIIYSIVIGVLLLLGIAHGTFTFIKYDTIALDAIWFCSASLGLIVCALLNYVNLNFPNKEIAVITTGANILQTLLTLVLAYNFPKGKTIFALIVVVSLLLLSLLFLLKVRNRVSFDDKQMVI